MATSTRGSAVSRGEATGSTERQRVTGGVLSVRRSLRLLELMSDDEGQWSLADIARKLAVNKAIALRLVSELCDANFVYRDEATGTYVLTYKMSNLGLRKISQTGVLDQSSGVLRELANTTGELVRLGVVEFGSRVTWVQAFAGIRRTLHIDANYRLEIQLNTHAAGKAWLFTLEPARAWALIKAAGVMKCTVYSKTRREEIEADLKQARARGFSLSYEENELGVGAIAAPVMVKQASGTRVCVGVISIAAPTSRMSVEELTGLAPELLASTARLGDMWPIGERYSRVTVVG
ncbi:DNA-binding IclR family transcriptional regulator OS=Castellaniella defragrans OX=75697 GN=HNR28_001027 PE=4 SV=1 [Castellaniella defragrans]